jgi:hypothetical protein
MGGSNHPLRRNQYAMPLAGHVSESGKIRRRNAILRVINVISNDDRDNMVRAPNPAWLPALTYIGQSRLFLGGKELQLYQFRGHTRGDTAVYFPAQRVITVGDLANRMATPSEIAAAREPECGVPVLDWRKHCPLVGVKRNSVVHDDQRKRSIAERPDNIGKHWQGKWQCPHLLLYPWRRSGFGSRSRAASKQRNCR